jgi:hypothetical protein
VVKFRFELNVELLVVGNDPPAELGRLPSRRTLSTTEVFRDVFGDASGPCIC